MHCHADKVDCTSLQLCDLYENDCIFDKFDCCVSGDGTRLATGSYSNLFKVSLVPDVLLRHSEQRQLSILTSSAGSPTGS